jgi:hypothetical protein
MGDFVNGWNIEVILAVTEKREGNHILMGIT